MNTLHLLISRVGIYWNHPNLKISWEEYIKDRIWLYNNLTKKSIKNQTNKNFILLSLYDKSLSNNIFDNMLSNEKNLFIDRIENGNYPWNPIINSIKQFVKNKNENFNDIIVTRIDSDDLIHEQFVENVKSNLNNKYEFADINNVYHLDNKNNRIYSSNKYKSIISPFVSIKEKYNNFKCIPYSITHDKISQIIKGKKYNNLSGIQVIHNNNMINKINGKLIKNFNLNEYYK